MSDWRHDVMRSFWRWEKHPIDGAMGVRYRILAAGRRSEDTFALVDMDCAFEGYGDEQAEHICKLHNDWLRPILNSGVITREDIGKEMLDRD